MARFDSYGVTVVQCDEDRLVLREFIVQPGEARRFAVELRSLGVTVNVPVDVEGLKKLRDEVDKLLAGGPLVTTFDSSKPVSFNVMEPHPRPTDDGSTP